MGARDGVREGGGAEKRKCTLEIRILTRLQAAWSNPFLLVSLLAHRTNKRGQLCSKEKAARSEVGKRGKFGVEDQQGERTARTEGGGPDALSRVPESSADPTSRSFPSRLQSRPSSAASSASVWCSARI